jgi:hypothetical protein
MKRGFGHSVRKSCRPTTATRSHQPSSDIPPTVAPSPTKDELRQIENSALGARLRLVLETTRVPAMERKILRKGLNLVPTPLRPLLEEYWSLFPIRKTFFWFKVPFRDVEICCGNIERRYLREFKPPERRLVKAGLRERGPQQVFKALRPAFEDLRYEYITELTLNAIRHAPLFEEVGGIHSGRFYKKAYLQAAARGDLTFCKRVANALKNRTPIDFKNMVSLAGSKLQRFLIEHWVNPSDSIPELYKLSIAELADLCRKHTKTPLDQEAIEKTRQRLKLISFRKHNRAS